MPKILVVDDEPGIREMLEIYLHREGYDVTSASNGKIALSCCKKEFYDVVISDIKMPEMDGMTLLQKTKEISPDTAFIMITAFASYETARESMKEDAYDYIAKPFDVEAIKNKIDSAIAKKKTSAVCSGTSQDSIPDAEIRFGMIGQSTQIRKIYDLIPKAASSKSNVLITGESGTGKELIARALHCSSPRGGNPFITINCGGIPETLLESELFGYKRGAFTGAARDKQGFLEAAEGGTLFLDEVAELPLSLQVKLLRMVQEKTFTPVGGTQEKKVDVRIISATNKNLEKKVMDNSFREDLYYRLNVINIYMPPLRDRKEDIPLIANFFINKYSREMEKDVSEISSYSMDCLMNYQFPGNIRELENIVEKGVALATTSIMLPESLELSKLKTGSSQKTGTENADDFFISQDGIELDKILEQYEKNYVREALKMSKGSITGAARLLGISFRSMRYRLEKFKIDEQKLEK